MNNSAIIRHNDISLSSNHRVFTDHGISKHCIAYLSTRSDKAVADNAVLNFCLRLKVDIGSNDRILDDGRFVQENRRYDCKILGIAALDSIL